VCNDYEFIDSRIRENNNFKFMKVNYIKYVAAMHTKQKHMERITRKNLTLRILEQREQDEKMRAVEAEEKRKKAQEEKGSRIQRQMLHLKRKNEMREAERKIRIIRDGVIKEIKMRREDARYKVEQTIDNEKPIKLILESPGFEQPEIESQSNEDLVSKLGSSRRRDLPLPSENLVRFSSDGFGKILELWGYIATLISILDMTSLPTINQLKAALEYTDPYMQRVNSKMDVMHDINRNAADGNISSSAFPSSSQAQVFLDEIGVALVKNLLNDFHSILKCDVNDELLGGLKFEFPKVARAVINCSKVASSTRNRKAT
jgi:hypothetical protein